MKKNKLSIVLATYNEEKNIRDCLQSIKDLADEIVVVDGSSTDKTAEIAKKLGAKVFLVSNKIMFHKNKQLALEKASGDWILQLDADERISAELTAEIKSEIRSASWRTKSEISGYYIPRKNYFLGKWLRKGGQYPDYVIRLIKKGKAHFPCKSVHEQIKVKGEVSYLKNPLIHFSSPSFSRYMRNANRYTSLTAGELARRNISLGFFSQLNYLFYRPLKTFFILYFRHKGFIDGFHGFVFAIFSGLHHFIAFVKYWEKKNLKKDFSF